MYEIKAQVDQALEVLDRYLGKSVIAVHLFGSAVDGGIKPLSDIDLFVALSSSPDAVQRRRLMQALLEISAAPGSSTGVRPLEITFVLHSEVVPWRYPAMRELQFGEWLRDSLLAGEVEPSIPDRDLAVLLTKVRTHSIALRGPAAVDFYQAIPSENLREALLSTLDLWNTPDQWLGDERNVILTLARIWFTLTTGEIAPKDIAAIWLLEQIREEHRPVLQAALRVYRGEVVDDLKVKPHEVEGFIIYAKTAICELGE